MGWVIIAVLCGAVGIMLVVARRRTSARWASLVDDKQSHKRRRGHGQPTSAATTNRPRTGGVHEAIPLDGDQLRLKLEARQEEVGAVLNAWDWVDPRLPMIKLLDRANLTRKAVRVPYMVSSPLAKEWLGNITGSTHYAVKVESFDPNDQEMVTDFCNFLALILEGGKNPFLYKGISLQLHTLALRRARGQEVVLSDQTVSEMDHDTVADTGPTPQELGPTSTAVFKPVPVEESGHPVIVDQVFDFSFAQLGEPEPQDEGPPPSHATLGLMALESGEPLTEGHKGVTIAEKGSTRIGMGAPTNPKRGSSS